MQNQEEISGTVERFVYKNEENGFAVFSIRQTTRNKITVSGIVPGLNAGEFAKFKGQWQQHKKFGLQFNVQDFERCLPTNEIGIEKYLSSGLIKGIGPEMARRLVAQFGPQTLDVIDKTPNLLLKVPGIGLQRMEKIIEAWKDQKEISQVMVFLRAKDIPVSLAGKIYKRYGQEAIETITHNPYRLSEDIWGVGFRTADSLALRLGLSTTSQHRIRAASIYTLKQASDCGHLYVSTEKANANTLELLQYSSGQEANLIIEQTYDSLILEDKVKTRVSNSERFFALPQCYIAEQGIAKRIKLLQSYKAKLQVDHDEAYKSLRDLSTGKNTIQLSDEQQHCVLSTMQQKISIITGGPGTGKTTIVKSLITLLKQQHAKIRLAAPTGRAAKRLFETTGHHAETLHRLLEFSPHTMRFERNEYNTLDIDILIVDETSMLDAFLAHSLLKAIPLHARLLFIGDIDQLPSVGPGNVLRDLINSGIIETTRLTEIFRQSYGSSIVENAHRINSGEFPQKCHDKNHADFIFVSQKNPEKLPDILRAIHDRLLPKRKICPENSILLSPMHRGNAGTQYLNRTLQEIINPADKTSDTPSISRLGNEYRNGDRVMQIRNNYDKFVFNGDIGSIVNVNSKDRELSVKFGEKTHQYSATELDELTLSYAVSIHKSQGSEFDAVIIPLFCQHYIMLQRNLLYTAVTRAKKLCVLIGEPRAIAMAIKNNKESDRKTFLAEILASTTI